MKELFAIFIGSGLGGILRFGLGRWVTTWYHHHFPLGTFVVNFLACLLLGFVIGLADHRLFLSPTARLFLTVGFCGGFSTFSTFSSETVSLLQQGYNFTVVFYIIGSLLICVAATFAGLSIGGRI